LPSKRKSPLTIIASTVSEQELAEAVQKVGRNAEDVAIELGKPW